MNGRYASARRLVGARIPGRRLLLSGLLFLGAALPGCRGPRSADLVVPPRLATAEEQAGEVTFMRFCNGCHPAGLGGLGPGLINKPLPGFAIRFQVRHGLGAMPSFPARVIPGEELDAVIAYLHAMRRVREVRSSHEQGE